MSKVVYSRTSSHTNEAHVKFLNKDNLKFYIVLGTDEQLKTLTQNENIECHYDRSNCIHCDKWLSFLRGEIKTLDLRYRSLFNTGTEIIVNNDAEEIDYFGYDIASFDLEEVISFTMYVIQNLKDKNNLKSISSSNYTMNLIGNNLVAHIDGKKRILIPNMHHYGDTYYGVYCKDSFEGRMNRNSMKENIDDLRNSDFTVSFKICGVYKHHISRKDCDYYFEECGKDVVIFEDSESLQSSLDKIANLYG